ncbi:recombinase family protein [Vibrio sp. F13]|uniref:recombinase family protein n=1 Tax=Vibrio sp. F13 TaxID=2070777 RepID=UPI0010BDDCC7|nr:recombinase family protein [Vibrio sp. F13]TKG12221.1 recombinase family protein [Vibrio sp. F13]
MALLGYARVSTNQQKLDLQVNTLIEKGVREDRIFTDKVSGAIDDRAGLKDLLIRAERDDIILCTKMDRLGRNTSHMIKIVDSCYKKGVSIRFLDNHLSTEGVIGKMVIQILSAVAEAERERILERTNEGRQAALEAGVQFGRKPHRETGRVKELLSQGYRMKFILQEVSISRSTYFRIKKQFDTEIRQQTVNACGVSHW